MTTKTKQEPQQPLILRCHRLMEAFAKSDEERDFYLDTREGFLIYVDLEKSEKELQAFEAELSKNPQRFVLIPKLTFYETKKIMEGFVHEKVYDIDTKEKLLDIIQSKEARYNFLEFIADHHAELEKWQQYYQERSRIRIIEWLRNNHFTFVFEEDLDFSKNILEKLKQSLFQAKIGKDLVNARKALLAKAKTYYSNEALNPRPKRGRPPKQSTKQEMEPKLTVDVYTTVPQVVRPFLFIPEIGASSAMMFSSKFESEQDFSANRKQSLTKEVESISIQDLETKLASLKSLSRQRTPTRPSSLLAKNKQIEKKKPKAPEKKVATKVAKKGTKLAKGKTKKRITQPKTTKKPLPKTSKKKTVGKKTQGKQPKRLLQRKPLKKIAPKKSRKTQTPSKKAKKATKSPPPPKKRRLMSRKSR